MAKTTQNNPKPVASKAEKFPQEKTSASKSSTPAASAAQELRSIPQQVASTFTTEVVGGVLDSFTMQLLGQPSSKKVESAPTVAPNQEAKMWKKRALHAENMRKEAEALIIRRQQEVTQKITNLRQDLKMETVSMTQAMVSWSKEADLATFQAPASPDIYHQTFFETLISFMRALKLRIRKSRKWLQAHNGKAAKKKGLMGIAMQGNNLNNDIYSSGERAAALGA